MIAQQVARDFPGALSHMVLSGTSPAFGSPDGDFQKRFIADRLGPLDAGKTMRDIADDIVQSLVAPGCPQAGMDVARQSMEQVSEATYRASMKLLVTFDLRASLSAISMPTLVLAAAKDTSAPAPMMEKMASRIPGARYVCIDDAGHLANLERPDAFNRAIADFLGDTDNG
jgi:pimeloyl-ACP methyl ester carboxylesterase